MAVDLIGRLRAANPAPDAAPVHQASGIYATIVAGPGDRRLARPRPRHRRRIVVLLAAGGVLAGGAALAQTLLSPDEIFRQNPIQRTGVGPGQLRDTIPGTARRVTEARVPDLGPVEIWAAKGTHDAVCLAARVPSGAWAEGGGCWPRRSDPTEREVYVQTGFDYREADFPSQADGVSLGYRVWFGIIEPQVAPAAVRIVDRQSGAEAKVIEGRFWAFAVHDPNGTAADVDLVAYDAGGRVVADQAAALRAVTPAP